MDPRIKAAAIKNIVDAVTRDESISGDLRRVITELMGADVKTLQHRVVDLDLDWGSPVAPPCLQDEMTCDYVTVVDANGRQRHLIFL